MKNILFSICLVSLLCVFGCSGEESSAASESLSQKSELQYIAAGTELSECDDSNEGTVVYVADSSDLYGCFDGRWENLDGDEADADTVYSRDTIYVRDTLSPGTGILAYHPDAEIVPKLENLVHQKRDSLFRLREQQVVILHFTDIHGDSVRLSRIKEFKDHYSEYIDDVVHTGDAVYNRWTDSYDFWHNSGADEFLNVLGNHDIKFKDQEGNVLNISQNEVYDRYFGPYIDSWDAVQPANASSEGLMYYYKDIDKGDGYERTRVRIIAVDEYHWDNKQIQWFKDVLDDALEKDFAVIALRHDSFKPNQFEDCPFASMEHVGDEKSLIEAQKAVDGFIKAGGEFVLWIGGHNHQDDIGTLPKYPNQVTFNGDIAGLNTVEWSDSWREDGTISQDCFTLIAVDRFEKMVRFLRVGANMDRYGRVKESMCINYKTAKLI